MDTGAIKAIETLMTIVTLTNFCVGLGGVIIITQFLIQHTKIDITIPWQIRTFIRILTISVFLYLFCLEIIIFVPETQTAKLKIFQDGLSWSGDLVKTLLGAIIGALSMNIAQDKDLDNIPDRLEDIALEKAENKLVKMNSSMVELPSQKDVVSGGEKSPSEAPEAPSPLIKDA